MFLRFANYLLGNATTDDGGPQQHSELEKNDQQTGCSKSSQVDQCGELEASLHIDDLFRSTNSELGVENCSTMKLPNKDEFLMTEPEDDEDWILVDTMDEKVTNTQIEIEDQLIKSEIEKVQAISDAPALDYSVIAAKDPKETRTSNRNNRNNRNKRNENNTAAAKHNSKNNNNNNNKNSNNKKQHAQCNRKTRSLEDSWIIHPPACFQLDNTFTIEEHPLENLFIEHPSISIISSNHVTHNHLSLQNDSKASSEEEDKSIIVNGQKSEVETEKQMKPVVATGKQVISSAKKGKENGNMDKKLSKQEKETVANRKARRELERQEKLLMKKQRKLERKHREQQLQADRERKAAMYEKQLVTDHSGGHMLLMELRCGNGSKLLQDKENVDYRLLGTGNGGQYEAYGRWAAKEARKYNRDIALQDKADMKMMIRKNKYLQRNANIKPFTYSRKLC